MNLKAKLLGGHDRTVAIKKNVLASFFIKGVSIVVNFLLVRITIDYLDPMRYGLWLTISSLFVWFTFFDIGLGNGLRNKLAEAVSLKQMDKAKIYVSTTYFLLLSIFSVLAIVFLLLNDRIPWSNILGVEASYDDMLAKVTSVVFGLFFLQFVLKLLVTILYAMQKPALANVFGPLSNLIILCVIFILTRVDDSGSLVHLSWVMGGVPLMVFIVASIALFSTKYKHIAPSWRHVQIKYASDLLSVGVYFFITQISGLFLYQTSNIIISHYIGPTEVTVYNVAYKYFMMISMVFSIITMPFWSAFTEAWTLKDYTWIKQMLHKLLKIWGGLMVVALLMLVVADFVYAIWLDGEVKVPLAVSIVVFTYFSTMTFGSIFVMFINGVGKIRLQMLSSIGGVVLFILLIVLLIYNSAIGIVGICIASIVGNFYGIFISPIQTHKILNNKAVGIWDK